MTVQANLPAPGRRKRGGESPERGIARAIRRAIFSLTTLIENRVEKREEGRNLERKRQERDWNFCAQIRFIQ